MASLSLPTPVDRPETAGIPSAARDVVRVVCFNQPVAQDYLAYVAGQGGGATVVTDEDHRVSSVVLFLGRRLTESNRHELDRVVAGLEGNDLDCLCVVSDFGAHLGDQATVETEGYILGRVKRLGIRTVVLRPGYVLSPASRPSFWLRVMGAAYPLVPRRFRGCSVEGTDLFATIEAERRATTPRRSRVLTLLGPNRPWRDVLASQRSGGVGSACLTGICFLLSWLMLGQLAGLAFSMLARLAPGFRRWNFDTLQPTSLGELLALVNRYNYPNVKVVGYNNGVNHFGQRFPGKTVVSTVQCHRIVRTGTGSVKADSGTTIRRALDFLGGSGQEMYVVPNYSYVCLGTAFFVPIHGSASDYSTIADTITRAVLYDPLSDRLLAVNRDDPEFREHLFNLQSAAVVLRLYFKVKPKARYFVQREDLTNPGSDQLLAALRDDRATNVEVRKANAAGDQVQLSRFYTDRAEAGLELPRDAIGRLWDRLEENPVTSFLMHALTRHLAWHVELFFTPEEFAHFWATHRELPLRKIQLRYIRRDGFPHSPFRDSDCVSADMFMFRKHRHTFEAFLKKNFPIVRANPGKHSA